jgi:hypothetical protein
MEEKRNYRPRQAKVEYHGKNEKVKENMSKKKETERIIEKVL